MDKETIAKDLIAACLAKNELPSEKDVGQLAKRLADFYLATLEGLAESEEGDITSVERESDEDKPWEK